MRTIKRLTLISLLFLIAGSPIQARDDYEFANGLMNIGYLDLAKEVFSGIKNDSSKSKEERAKGELGLIRILKVEAEKESDPEKQQQAFDTAITGLSNFVANYKSLKEAKDAKLDLGFLLQAKGKKLTKQAERTGEDQYREVAAKALEEAIELFDGISSAAEPGTEEWLKAKFYSFESLYYFGICYNKGDPKRDAALKKSVKQIEEFAWDYEGMPVAYFAYMIQGDCYVAMEKFDEAVTSYDAVCSLPADVPAAKEIRQRGFLAKATGLVNGARFKNALNITKDYFTDYSDPSEKKSNYGLGMVLQQARAYGGLGDIGQALSLAQGISDADQGYWGREAQFFITSLPIGGKLPTKTAYSIAEGHRKRGNFGKAIDHYELAVSGGSTDEDFKTLIPKSWYALGASYFELQLYDAAAKSFQAGADLRQGDKELLADNAYWAMRAYQELRLLTRNENHIELYKKARGNLTKKFPNSKYVRGGTLTFLEGNDLKKNKDYDKAIAEFKKLKPEDSKYERAQVEIGVCYYKRGQDNKKDASKRDKFFKQATEQFEKCFKYAKKHSLDDPEKQAERDISLANATFFTASMSADLEEWPKVIKYANDFINHKVYSKQTGLVAALYYYQVKAYCKQKKKDLPKAIKIYNITKANPKLAKSGYLSNMAQMIGIQINKKIIALNKKIAKEKNSKKKKKYEKEVAELEPKAADYLYLALSESRRPNPNTANVVGNLLYKVNRFKEAGEMFTIAYQSDKTSKRDKLIMRLKLAQCLVESKRWAEALPFYRQLVAENAKNPRLRQYLAKTYVGLGEQRNISGAQKLLLRLLPETVKEEEKTAAGYSIKDMQKYIKLRYPDIAEKLETDEKFNTAPLKILNLIHKKRTQDAQGADKEEAVKLFRHYLWREALAIYIDIATFVPRHIESEENDSELNNPLWWEAKFYIPYLYEKCGNKEKAYKLAKQIAQLYPSLGEDFGFKTKFEDLLERLKTE